MIRALVASIATALFTITVIAHPHADVKQQVVVEIHEDAIMVRLVIRPSKASSSDLIGLVDLNNDKQMSDRELNRFAQTVLSEVSLISSGVRLKLDNIKASAVLPQWFAEGYGQIEINAQASVVMKRSLPNNVTFEINYSDLSHIWQTQPYLAKLLISEDRAVQIQRQKAGFSIRF
jgi:hypothetical protein